MLNLLKAAAHGLYLAAGHVLCKMCLLYWNLRDWVNRPNEDTVLFVAHPDDDTLFFHTFIQEKKPYVVLMTTGWSFRERMPDFFRVMKHYGVRYRAYDFSGKGMPVEAMQRICRRMQKIGSFSTIATHNCQGEYGHYMHRCVHQAVTGVFGQEVLVPADVKTLLRHPLSMEILREKEAIFKQMYQSEVFVLWRYKPWFCHEHLVSAGTFGLPEENKEKDSSI